MSACEHGCAAICNFCKLEKRISVIEIKLHELNKTFDKKPHRCPNCDGMSFTQLMDTDGIRRAKECKSCNAKGIVWG